MDLNDGSGFAVDLKTCEIHRFRTSNGGVSLQNCGFGGFTFDTLFINIQKAFKVSKKIFPTGLKSKSTKPTKIPKRPLFSKAGRGGFPRK